MIGPAEVREERRDGTAVAHIEGEIDASNVAAIGTRLRGMLGNEAYGLVVDLTEVAYLDSAGINLLFVLGDELGARQQRLRLVVSPGTPIERMLSVTALDRTQPTYPTLEAALAAG
jgi:anti-anti-sigma factor